jgi:ribosomal protein S18 acetylase RimI-like enzyme
MSAAGTSPPDAAARARAWHHAAHAAVCDLLEPWAHGTVARASRYPSYYAFNVVRVEVDPGLDVPALAAFADEALAGLGHRCLDFEILAAAEARRADFEAAGWRTMRLLWMRHEGASLSGPAISVEEVPYDAVEDLRSAWHGEDFADLDAPGFDAQAREVALLRGAQVLSVREGGLAVGFAQLEREGRGAEITQVYVLPEHRGAGCGKAITRAAIEAAGDVEDLWICADDEARAKHLYARLGFQPAWTTMEFLRVP